MAEIYGYSFCGEQFYGRYETRDAALSAAKAEDPESGTCLTCRGVDIQPWSYLPNGWELIEKVEDGIADNHANEDAIFSVSAEQRVDLERRIERAFQEWMYEHRSAWREYYEADDVQTHTWPVESAAAVGAVDPVDGIVAGGPRAKESV